MSPAVDYGALCWELECFQEFGYKRPVDNRVSLVVRKPLSLQRTEWVWAIRKAYLESVYRLTLFPLDRWRAWVRAISSAFCKVVPFGSCLSSVSRGDHCIGCPSVV